MNEKSLLTGMIFFALIVLILFIIGAYWLIVIGLALIIVLIGFIYKKFKKRK
ncbi:MAG: LPXTG cell wall anchor domain-containing protein [Anaerorhabdus sp.]|uniref:LPXTG cell wall anchor domain-containing protein n=1 Tax=Anaerorhabdus sp. TaxID=1872524 RepID=UPI003A86858C